MGGTSVTLPPCCLCYPNLIRVWAKHEYMQEVERAACMYNKKQDLFSSRNKIHTEICQSFLMFCSSSTCLPSQTGQRWLDPASKRQVISWGKKSGFWKCLCTQIFNCLQCIWLQNTGITMKNRSSIFNRLSLWRARCQSITGITPRDRQSFTLRLIPTANLESPVNH